MLQVFNLKNFFRGLEMQYNFFLNLKARNYTYIQKNCANIEIKTTKCLKSQFFIKIKIIMQKKIGFLS